MYTNSPEKVPSFINHQSVYIEVIEFPTSVSQFMCANAHAFPIDRERFSHFTYMLFRLYVLATWTGTCGHRGTIPTKQKDVTGKPYYRVGWWNPPSPKDDDLPFEWPDLLDDPN